MSTSPYRLTPEVEDELTVLCCTQPAIWPRLGQAFDPNRLVRPGNRTLVRAARTLAQGGAPSRHFRYVLQVVYAHLAEWKIRMEEFEELRSYVGTIERQAFFSDRDQETVVVAITTEMQRGLIRDAEEDFYAGQKEGMDVGRLTETIEKIRRVQTVGREFVSTGRLDEPDGVEERAGATLRLGMGELDDHIDGGLGDATYTQFMAQAGGGKSIALTQVAASFLLQKRSGLYITLELRLRGVRARVLAALTDVPQRDIMARPERQREALARYDQLVRQHACGRLDILEGMDGEMSIDQVESYVRDRSVGFLIVDYVELLDYRDERGRDAPIYAKAQRGAAGLRKIARKYRIPVVSAQQATEKDRVNGKPTWVDAGSTYGGQSGIKIADFIFGIETSGDNRTTRVRVIKARDTDGRYASPELPTDFPYGRLVAAETSYRTLYPERTESQQEIFAGQAAAAWSRMAEPNGAPKGRHLALVPDPADDEALT